MKEKTIQNLLILQTLIFNEMTGNFDQRPLTKSEILENVYWNLEKIIREIRGGKEK